MNIRNTYVKCYNLCCEKIKEANDIGLTDIIFELPTAMFITNTDCSDVNIIKYIDINLRKEKLNTYIINNRKIFVTWKFIELNKEVFRFYS